MTLFQAALQGDAPAVQKLLDEGADPTATDQHGNTALHLAAGRNHMTVVALLLQRDVPVNKANGQGLAPLHFAAIYGAESAAKALLRAGAEPGMADAQGRAPADLAQASGHEELAAMLHEKAGTQPRKARVGLPGMPTHKKFGRKAAGDDAGTPAAKTAAAPAKGGFPVKIVVMVVVGLLLAAAVFLGPKFLKKKPVEIVPPYTPPAAPAAPAAPAVPEPTPPPLEDISPSTDLEDVSPSETLPGEDLTPSADTPDPPGDAAAPVPSGSVLIPAGAPDAATASAAVSPGEEVP